MHQIEEEYIDTVLTDFMVYGHSQKVIDSILEVAGYINYARVNGFKKTSVRKLTPEDEGKYLYYNTGHFMGYIHEVSVDDGTDEHYRPCVITSQNSGHGYSYHHSDDFFYITDSPETVEAKPYEPRERGRFGNSDWDKLRDSYAELSRSLEEIHDFARNPEGGKSDWRMRRAINSGRKAMNTFFDIAENVLETGKEPSF